MNIDDFLDIAQFEYEEEQEEKRMLKLEEYFDIFSESDDELTAIPKNQNFKNANHMLTNMMTNPEKQTIQTLMDFYERVIPLNQNIVEVKHFFIPHFKRDLIAQKTAGFIKLDDKIVGYATVNHVFNPIPYVREYIIPNDLPQKNIMITEKEFIPSFLTENVPDVKASFEIIALEPKFFKAIEEGNIHSLYKNKFPNYIYKNYSA